MLYKEVNKLKNIQDICVDEKTSITESIRRLDLCGKKILLITSERKLVGVVTDGDVRRWILRNGSFEERVDKMMHRAPKVVMRGETELAKKMLLSMQIEAIPVVNHKNEPIDIIFLRDIIDSSPEEYEQISIPVVIMAGGKGTRLYPYTTILPKPLIPIGEITILERIINSFLKNGCKDFWLTLNYKKNIIKAYLDDLDKIYQVKYVEEKNYLGTCGSIGLLKEEMTNTFFVSNCDVLLDVDYADVLRYHRENKNELTLVTSLKYMQMPYGVVDLEQGRVKEIIEKPTINYNVNTGVYVVEPSVIDAIPTNTIFHMTDLVKNLLASNRKVGAYPIMEKYWRDMGEIEEMKKMIQSFDNN